MKKATPMKLLSLWMVFCITLTSCLKDDMPVSPPTPGNVETVQIPMGQNYTKQFFFDLGTHQIVSENLKNDWDLGFENGNEGHHIILNSSKFMFAWNMHTEDFNAVTDEAGATRKWDVASGNLDSTAIGEWGDYADGTVSSFMEVYVIDMGRDESAQPIGFKKVVFEDLSNGIYTVRYANLNGTEEKEVKIEKKEGYSFSYLSFKTNSQVNIAPEKNSWDLEFTQYTHIFSETPDNIPKPDTITPYLVTGVLQNRNGVQIAEDFTHSFDNIQFTDTYHYNFSDDLDIIGYDWKLYNFNQAFYSIVPGKNYIIKDTEGYFYKLRFIDFYSSTGEKGFPKFEYQRL